MIVYRRSEAELPARVEEVHHAKQEGIEFRMLTNPTAVLGDDKGWVRGLNCVEMELGEPDASGRRSPVEKPGSDFEIECDVVVMALGTSPNPLLSATTSGLETTRRGCLVADEEGATVVVVVFAAGCFRRWLFHRLGRSLRGAQELRASAPGGCGPRGSRSRRRLLRRRSVPGGCGVRDFGGSR